jgi:hypothetical protein
MATAAGKAGLNAQIYRYGTALNGTTTTGYDVIDSGDLMVNVGNLKVPGTRVRLPTNKRSSDFKTARAGQVDATIEFDMFVDTADADYLAVRLVHSLPLTTISLAVVDDGYADDWWGYAANYAITQMSLNGKLEEAQKVTVKAKMVSEPQGVFSDA